MRWAFCGIFWVQSGVFLQQLPVAVAKGADFRVVLVTRLVEDLVVEGWAETVEIETDVTVTNFVFVFVRVRVWVKVCETIGGM